MRGGEEKQQQEVPDENQSAGRRTRHRDHQDGAISKRGEVMKVNGLKQRKISLFPARAMFRSGLPGMYSALCWTPLYADQGVCVKEKRAAGQHKYALGNSAL